MLLVRFGASVHDIVSSIWVFKRTSSRPISFPSHKQRLLPLNYLTPPSSPRVSTSPLFNQKKHSQFSAVIGLLHLPARMYFTSIITAGLALLGSVVTALPNPDNAVGPAEGQAVPTNQGQSACHGNSGLNLFNGTKGTGACQDYAILNDGTCLWFDPTFDVQSVHLRDGVGWSVLYASALRWSLTAISSALYSSHTCDIESENDHAGSLLQSVDNLYADQPGFTKLTFFPRGWQCSYWPPAAASVASARSVNTTADAQTLAPGTLMLCDKPNGQGHCGTWSFQNNTCVSIGDDFNIVSIYIGDKTQW